MGGCLEAGDRVQRYVVRRLLGTGGAGRVYAAFDPDLNREIALKILNEHGGAAAQGSAGRQRLIREARAMASLSHDNVAEVHHAGEFDGGIFIAMELLPGGTLSEWIFDAPRTWEETLDKFVAAGRGLAHAHAAGIVHRDFKPDNVLLNADGVPRVLDFGLARREDRPTPQGSRAPPAETLEPISGISARLGTPAYMAPEQHWGREVDARADQFSFAIALYEALWGRRPFSGRSLTELAVAVTTGAPEVPPATRRVPRRVWRALRRALAKRAADRFVDMNALLDALRIQRSGRNHWVLAGVGATLVAGAVTWSLPRTSTDIPCEVGAARLTAVWGENHADQIDARFEATKVAYADQAARAVTGRMATWSAAWHQAYLQTCTAAKTSDGFDEDARMVCLSGQLAEVGSLVNLLRDADAKVVERAAELAASIPPIAQCDQQTSRVVELRADGPDREDYDRLRGDVAAITAMEKTGRLEPALARARQLSEWSRDNHAPAIAIEGELRLGMMLERTGDYDGALEHLTEASHRAASAELSRLTIDAGVELTFLTGYRLSQADEGQRWARSTRAHIARTGGDAEAEARLLNNEATIYERQGDYQAAFDAFDRARAMHEAIEGPDGPSIGRYLINMGLLLHRLGRPAEAEPHLVRAITLLRRTHGQSHPLVVSALNNLGIALEHQGRLAQADERYREALALGEQVFGKDHPSVVSALNNLANVAISQGRIPDAVELVRRGLTIREQAFGPDHPRTAFSVRALANALSRQGDTDAALALYRRALASYERELAPDHPEVAATLEPLGRTLSQVGKTEAAIAVLERALEIRLAALGPSHRDVGITQLRLGQAHARAGAMPDAQRWFERAQVILAAELPLDDPDRLAAMRGPGRRADSLADRPD